MWPFSRNKCDHDWHSRTPPREWEMQCDSVTGKPELVQRERQEIRCSKCYERRDVGSEVVERVELMTLPSIVTVFEGIVKACDEIEEEGDE